MNFNDDKERINSAYARDFFLHFLIWLGSFAALAGIQYLYWNGEKVDEFIKMILK